MILVLIESPFAPVQGPEAVGLNKDEYAAAIAENIAYAKAAVRDCLSKGEAPYASHIFFTQEGLLDDRDPEQRKLGIEAGLLWGAAAQKTVVYIDRGMSNGMRQGIARAKAEGRAVIYRSLVTGEESTEYDEMLFLHELQAV
jgi:hypothetical protein